MSVLHATRVNTAEMIPVDLLQGESEVETALLREYAAEARSYLESFPWCTAVSRLLYGVGVGGVIAVFFAQLAVKGVAREWLWVVVGDLPAAYLPESSANTACEALHAYCASALAWTEAVARNDLQRPPLALRCEATEPAAREVQAKLHTLRWLVLPAICTCRKGGAAPPDR